MKKYISMILSIVMLLSTIAPTLTALADEIITETKYIKVLDASGLTVTDDIPVVDANNNPTGDISLAFKSALDYCSLYASEFNVLTIKMPAGEFYITKTNYASDNTIMDMTNGTRIINRCKGSGNVINSTNNPSYSYEGTHNFTIIGGELTYDEQDYYNESNLIRIAHSNGFYIKNVKFTECYKSHYIEVAASTDVVFDNCIFDGFIKESTSSSDCIALQIDILEESTHFKGFPYYDGTMNDNIVVRNCQFLNMVSGIGTRAAFKNKYQQNIIVESNTFSNLSGLAITCTNYENVTISNNEFEDCAYGVKLNNSRNCLVTNNIFSDNSVNAILLTSSSINNTIMNNSIDTTGSSAIVVNSGCNNNIIESNDIDYAGKNGILIGGANIPSIQKNTIAHSNQYGIQVNTKGNVSIIKGNTFDGNKKYAISFDKGAVANVYANTYKNQANKYGFTKGEKKDVTFANVSNPSLSAIKKSGKNAILKWNKCSGANKYYIYRATSKNGTYKYIGSTTKTTYTNKKLAKGKYYYKVMAVKEANGVKARSNYSNIRGKNM